jgi:tetratricopeptide (TPR) repeat protein
MVGRDAEHAELRRRLEDAIAGNGTIMLVGGEPGIGKTRLTQALLADARQRGCFAVVGHCYEGEGAPPYIPFVETLEYSARVVAPSSFRHALGDAAPEVAKLMPELRQLFSDIPPPIQLPPEQQRRFLFNAYREFVERCCVLSPLVMILEDLHWADEPTLQLLQHLAQTTGTMPLLIVGTYRDVELDVRRPFARTLETLLRERQASRIALHRLPASGVESMLRALSAQPPPPPLVRVIFQETEGNPFFVEEVFQHLTDEARLFDPAGGWRSDLRVDTLQVPEGVRLVIGRRMERLSEATRRMLTTAAVIGRTFSVAVLEALESAQPDVVLDALEEAARAHLVTPESLDREPRFRFTHELIRQTLADALLLPRRQRLHARIAEAIERVYATSLRKQASPLAHHLFHAGAAVDADKTIRHLVLAADQAKTAAAHEESLELLDRALSLCDEERSGRVADLHARRAGALRSLGRTAETIEGYQRAIALFDGDGSFEQAAVTRNVLALLHIWNWRFDEGLRLLDQALARPEAITPGTRCTLFVSRALGLGGCGELDGAFAAKAQAQELQQTLGNDGLDVLTSSVEVHLRLHALHIDRAVEIAGEVTRRTQLLDDAWAEAEMSFVEPLAGLYCGRLDEFTRLTAERLPRAERLGHWNVVWFFKMFLPFEALYRGAFEESEQRSRDCMAFGENLQTAMRYTGQLFLGLSYALRGQCDEGIAHLRVATDAEVRSFISGVAPTLLAWVLAQEGHPHRALDVLSTHPPRLPATGVTPTAGAWMALANLIPTLALVAQHEQTAALHSWAEQLVTVNVCTYGSPVMFATSAGIAAAHAKQWTRAEAHHQRAIQQADAGYRICQPDARVWYADMLLARDDTGDRERARVLLAEALALYDSIGMTNFARRTSARLATVQ